MGVFGSSFSYYGRILVNRAESNVPEMATEIDGSIDEDSRTAIFERKRPHDVATHDDNSNAGSTKTTPRKRIKHSGKLGYQDVRDFVPNGANFSTRSVSIGEGSEGEDESRSEKSDREIGDSPSASAGAISGKEDELAVNEGRRVRVGNLHGLATETDIRQLFSGYSMYVLSICPSFRPCQIDE